MCKFRTCCNYCLTLVKLSYLEGWRCIQIANEIFGFEGWSHTIVDITVDFLDCVDGKFSLGVSAVVRVSIKGGGSHEDVGYGSIDNSRSKALAFEKAKKEAVTDALKRAMRAYGNSLGNCLYDKDYTKRVAKFGKPKYRELKVDDMYRERTDFVIEEPVAPKVVHQPMPAGPTTSVVQKVVAVEDEFAEFDDDILPADIETWDSCNLAASPVPHQLSGAQVSIGPHTQRLSQIQPANRNHSQNGFTFASQLVSTNAPPMGNTTRPSVVMHQRPSLNAAPALSNINQPKR